MKYNLLVRTFQLDETVVPSFENNRSTRYLTDELKKAERDPVALGRIYLSYLKGCSFNTWQSPSSVISLRDQNPDHLVNYVIHILNGQEAMQEPQVSCSVLKQIVCQINGNKICSIKVTVQYCTCARRKFYKFWCFFGGEREKRKVVEQL